MKRAAIYLVFALIVGGVVATLISRDPGYVLVAYDGLSLETSLWFALVAVAVAYAAVRVVLALLRRASRTGAAMRLAREARRVREAREQTVRGLLALVERDWTAARNALLGSAQHTELPLVNYLGAAHAAASLGEHDASASLVRQAVDSTPGAALGVGLIAAAIERDAGRAQQARARLDALHKEAPRNVEVSRRLATALREAGDWDALATLADETAKQKGFGEDEAKRLQIDAWVGRLDAAGPETLPALSSTVPKSLRDESDVLGAHARALARTGSNDAAADLLERALDKAWSTPLVELYGRIAASRPDERLARAERWRAAHGRDAALLLALGRIASRANAWPKARECFEAALDATPSAAACAELGRLCALQGDATRAVELQSRALALAGVDLSELAPAQRGASRR